MALLEQINIRGTTVLMVTHAKDIVDKMNKRVVAIDQGHIVRDEEGSYGYKQQGTEDDLYVPGFTSFTDDPIKARTMQLDPELTESIRGKTISMDPPTGDELYSILDEYLDGGDDSYE